jgi:hypothetical protein
MAEVLMNLNDYLDEAGRKRWRYGYVDCQMFAADWVLALTGKDPAADIRGTYSTAEEANALVASRNGCVALVHERLYPLGWKWIFSGPRDGDIGVIEVETAFDGKRRLIPAIHQDGLWLSKSLRGIRGGEFKPEGMWTP